MARIRCPECSFTFTTDRGVVAHSYAGSTPSQIRSAREALQQAEYEIPLPVAITDEDAPPWLSELGVQGHLGDVVEWIGAKMGDIDG